MKKRLNNLLVLVLACFILFNFSTPIHSENSEEIEENLESDEDILPEEEPLVMHDGLALRGEAALLVDEDTGAILYSKNINERLFPASTTKVMTAILALELGNLDDLVTVDEEVINLTKGSHIALDYNEELSLDNMIKGLLVASGNDAALAIAKHISGDIDSFVALMNEKAVELGAINTHFSNPHGLHDDNHYTTAYDLYLITKYAMDNEKFREYVNIPYFEIEPTNKKSETRHIYNTNKFLNGTGQIVVDGEYIPVKKDVVHGVKTGFTDEAMNCLITYADNGSRGLYSIVLKSDGYEVYSDTHKLLEHGFNNFRNQSIGSENEFIDNIQIEGSDLPFIPVVLNKSITYPVNLAKEVDIIRDINILDNIKLPLKKGDKVGEANFYQDDTLLGTIDIVSTIDVDKQVFSLKNLIFFLPLLIIILFLVWRTYISVQRKKRRKRIRRYNS